MASDVEIRVVSVGSNTPYVDEYLDAVVKDIESVASAGVGVGWHEISQIATKSYSTNIDEIEKDSPIDWFLAGVSAGAYEAAVYAVARLLGLQSGLVLLDVLDNKLSATPWYESNAHRFTNAEGVLAYCRDQEAECA